MDNPRVLLAIALSFIILLMWQSWMDDYGPAPEQQVVEGAATETTDTTGEQIQPAPDDMPTSEVLAQKAVDSLPDTKPSAQPAGEQIEVLTDTYRAVIDTRGGTLVELDLLQYPETHDPDSPPFKLLEQGDAQLFIAQSGLRTGKTDAEPNHHALFTADQTHYRLADGAKVIEVPLHWTDSKGVQVTKTYRFHRSSYLINVGFEVANKSSSNWSARPYYQLQRTPLQKKSRFLYTYTGGVIYSPEEKYEKISFSDMEDENLSRDIKGGWAAMLQHYFLGAIIPDPEATAHYYTRALGNERYLIGFSDQGLSVAPGEQAVTGIRFFAGPKLQHMMAEVAPGLELTVDYGKLTLLAQPIFWLLEKIHALVGNWGWSIIFLTMLIKGMFFKLSETSYRSMAKMRNLAPRMKALKERYGDDKQKLNQAMMEMYKTEKVNPLGGCLPVLVQIPVFIALYWVLLESVEMRQAPFMLWLQDLSSADPYFILPLLMGITMLIQQKLNPAPMDPIQAKVMMVLPVVFTVFFAFFPSGLVLYWVVNNTLSIAQQYVITKRVERGEA
ncbi:protein translocase subunit yidC [Thiogranum longum]|uniref:Membrane protein insertase YidC n=1 Tax=Thiogranum longum TaxID=1537524 RepID=A0A4R1HCF4_9GAMM|nr:membrane protein insertase YidC [Thiogranum longum]TCK16899.1 protein translocase subunit yidC [Thiogranum longum]